MRAVSVIDFSFATAMHILPLNAQAFLFSRFSLSLSFYLHVEGFFYPEEFCWVTMWITTKYEIKVKKKDFLGDLYALESRSIFRCWRECVALRVLLGNHSTSIFSCDYRSFSVPGMKNKKKCTHNRLPQGGRQQPTVRFCQQINENDNNKRNKIDAMRSVCCVSVRFFSLSHNEFHCIPFAVSFLLWFKWTRQGC